jgi:hypothetical protein
LDINEPFFYTRLGTAVAPKKEHAFADYTRECWDIADGGQLVFADWNKLVN